MLRVSVIDHSLFVKKTYWSSRVESLKLIKQYQVCFQCKTKLINFVGFLTKSDLVEDWPMYSML